MRLYALPHILILVLCLGSIMSCVLRIAATGAFYDAVILYWLGINVKNLFFAVCFMLGRSNLRAAERFDAVVDAEIEYEGRVASGKTCDLSETGMAVITDRPIYVPPDGTFSVRLRAGAYESEAGVELIYVTQQGAHRKYCMRIVNMDESNRRAYLQTVFDRDHSLPKTLSPTVGLYEGFTDNIAKRVRRRGRPVRR
jgi:cellulose synthase (UDP-forming)